MNIWLEMLTDAPATLQRLIARANRVSLPRGATPAVRLDRLRLALCHAATVRVTYFAMERDEQAALQHLRTLRGGMSPDELAARYGPVRPWSQITADLTPQSLSEQLILHGFLLPRPATKRHPARFLLPPEVRRWLPRPLALPDAGAAPAPPPAPALRVATTILLACAERPLPLRQDGQLRLESRRCLAARLAPLDDAAVAAQCRFVLPLLIDMGCLAPHGADAALAPNGARFLALPEEEQLSRLRAAWVGMPRPDAWLRPLLVEMRGLDWPLLRRRLLAWAAALPQDRLLDPTALHDALTDALGPLADPHTHGYRPVDRAPWQPKRAAAVWDAALRGPLTWLGSIAWTDAPAAATPRCFATPVARAEVADADERPLTMDDRPLTMDDGRPTMGAWRYGALGEIVIPHAALDAAVLRLLPYAQWQAADAATSTYQITSRRLATARRDGFSTDALAALLERQAGPLPDAWRAWLVPTPAVQIVYGAVVTSDDPAVLDRAAQQRSVRRYLHHLAPGIALANPERVESLTRALGRQDLSVERRGAPEVARPSDLSAAECATLLSACACYRQHAPGGVAPDALAQLEERLRAALPFDQRVALGPAAPAPPVVAAPPLVAGVAAPERVPLPAVAPPDPLARGLAAPARAGARPNAARVRGATPPVPPALRPALLRAAWLTLWLALSLLLATLWRRRVVVADRPVLPAAPMPTAHPPPPAAAQTTAPDSAQVATALPTLHQAIERRQPLEIVYQAVDGASTTRLIRPLRLEGHGDCWYLHAYCTLRHAERVFRVDRITAMRLVRVARRRGRPTRQERPAPLATAPRPTRRRRPAPPRASFFAPPPTPPPGSPLVRVWLAD